MRALIVSIGLAYLGSLATAIAHTQLRDSVPSDGAVITSAPARIALNFSLPSRLGALSIQRDSEEPRRLGPNPSTSAEHLTIALPALQPGTYLLRWRAQGSDGHISRGQIRFTVLGRRE